MTVARRFLVLSVVAVLVWGMAGVPAADANHTWGNYHWARTANPFTIQLGDNVTGAWDASLVVASADWTKSTVLDTQIVTGASNPKTCKPVQGRVEVCNARYGRNGWLGIAQIWLSGDHIVQGTTKLNDTYFASGSYNTPAWRALVTCQEVGHTFGLGHQDENFDNANLGTCMDYTRDPSTNQHPNAHDYQLLEQIYSHTDSTTTVGAASAGSGASPGQAQNDWGRAMGGQRNGNADEFEKDLGNGQKVLTHVFWLP